MPRFVPRVVTMTLAAVAVFSAAVEAQIVRRPAARRPLNWGGVSVGIAQGYTLDDGTTGARWSFGSGLEYAARFEHPTGSGIAIGLQGAYARPSLTYAGPACTNCDAKATVTQVMGLLHYGQGYTFHPIYELAAGAIGYSNFRASNDAGTRLGASGTDYDFKFSLGYGLGFGLSPNTAIEVVQEFGMVLHQKDGLSGSASNYPRVYVTRLGGKFAF